MPNPQPGIDPSASTALVTGANAGIGKATAQGLAERGGHVFLLCRSEERGEQARQEIVEATGNVGVELVRCDLSSLAEVRRAAAGLRERCERLDVLVNNAGCYQGRHATSADGLELTWAVNHFAPFLLTTALRPLLEATAETHGEARVVNVSSGAHRGASLNLEEVAQGGPGASRFSGMRAYARTKLANVLFTREWARRQTGRPPVAANAVHPGVVATNIWNDTGGFLATVAGWFTFLYSAPATGAAGPLRLATDPALKGTTGSYFSRTASQAPSKAAQDDEAARRLWEISEKVIRRVAGEAA